MFLKTNGLMLTTMAVKNCFLNMASQVGFMHSAKYYKEGDNGVSLRPFLSYTHLVHDIRQLLLKTTSAIPPKSTNREPSR